MLKNNLSSYGSVAKFFHWIMALLMISMLTAGFLMTSIPASKLKWSIYNIHKATGVMIFAFALTRLTWRVININPMNVTMANWQKIISNITHYLLYLLMFSMTISGLVMSLFGGYTISMFGLCNIPASEKNPNLASFFHDFHGIAGLVLLALVTLHICAALYHHLWLKDDVLKRML